MNYFLEAGLVFALLALGWFAWRYFRLRRAMDAFARVLRRAAEDASPAVLLPRDQSGVEELSNAVRALAESLEARMDEVDTERLKLAAVLDRMTDGVLIADANGRVTFLNPAAERLFDAADALGRTVAEVLRQHQLVDAWRRSRESGEAQEESVELPARRQYLHLIVLPNQQTGGSLLMVQDLTRVRRLETVRRDFISNVSHELRTPLASLKALTETLRDGALSDPKAAPRFLGRIETEVDALTQMAQELLDLTRIESGQVALDLKPVAPGKLLASAANRMRAQAERAKLRLTVDPVAADLPQVRADAARLEQVLVNLVHNAVKFTGPKGAVALSASADGKLVRFAVRDTGVGIPDDDIERIFERFYKADRARSGGGTGLGLSIARHIVEAHRGRIWAESVEGKGSTFFFTIPVF
jgi:two-component system phosphate regulon sensor histidine kinase PhoR